ncbi:protein trichome birefringence-like 41 [Coffea arabica]|uniref:Protein trichome birefringence-like 41 n=1 Tax=Coffea arabica TaxID=13443 RepID=A0ABM4UD45_COFAR|nr:protein trichome birefringence-like 41 [Coffea arabica]
MFFIVSLLFLPHLLRANAENCDFFQGSWVFDESYPMYNSSICPFIEKEFNCLNNGRPDHLYLKYRWQPQGCDLAKFDGRAFLQKFRGKSILFAGDSLTRDQYMSLACLLYTSVPGTNYNMTRVGLISTLKFLDYGLTLILDRNAFLVDLVPEKIGVVLKLDSVAGSEKLWSGHDLLAFNTWHWWGYKGAQQPWKYIQIGTRLLKDMDRMVAFETALETWAKWVDTNVDPAKTTVFFLGVSPSHYKGSDWNQPQVKNCAGQTRPVPGPTYPGVLPPALAVQKKVLSEMRVPVKLLDITTLSQFRVDAHPSFYGAATAAADCTHWCIAGLPDTWNQLLYNLLY